jgi:hypothetical protein
MQHSRAGRYDDAVADSERATVIARELGGAALAHALLWESQERMELGQLELSAELLAEAERTGAAVHAMGGWPAYTVRGDLALLPGRPLDAVEQYALSLEVSREEGEEMQVHLDLVGMADAMAMSGRDEDALEIAGIAAAHVIDLGGHTSSEWHVQGHDRISEVVQRLGAEAAERSRARGLAVPASGRVLRACALARAGAWTERRVPAARVKAPLVTSFAVEK